MNGTINFNAASSPRTDDRLFPSIDIDAALPDLAGLHALVLRQNSRVELRGRDGQASVLITKSELEALEHALEILSDTQEVRAMSRDLMQIVASASSNPYAATPGQVQR